MYRTRMKIRPKIIMYSIIMKIGQKTKVIVLR